MVLAFACVKKPGCLCRRRKRSPTGQADTELSEILALMKGLPQDGLRYKKLDQESLEVGARHGQLTTRAVNLESEIATQLALPGAITDALQFNCDALEGLDYPTRLQMRRTTLAFWLLRIRSAYYMGSSRRMCVPVNYRRDHLAHRR
jgi:hypothetical protein